MEEKFYIENDKIERNIEDINSINNIYSFFPTNDMTVNDFLNKNITLETVIENEIFKDC